MLSTIHCDFHYRHIRIIFIFDRPFKILFIENDEDEIFGDNLRLFMPNNKKFKISGLKKKESFADASKVILRDKLQNIYRAILAYQKNDSPENLHILRITFRRFRYNLELFYSCVKPKLFQNVYTYIKHMQDIIGELRDLDVLEEKIRQMESEIGYQFPEHFYEKIQTEKSRLKSLIKTELDSFVTNEDLKKFLLK